MLCDELKTQSLREIFSPKRETDKLMLPQEVNRFPDSRLSFVLLTIVFRKLSLTWYWHVWFLSIQEE